MAILLPKKTAHRKVRKGKNPGKKSDQRHLMKDFFVMRVFGLTNDQLLHPF